MRRFAVAYCFLGSLLATGCTNASGPERVDGHVAETQAPIAYGSPDTIHTAVVALIGNTTQGQFACSGSIVQVKNGQGYVLTAAHCCADAAPNQVVTGTNYASQSAPAYNVVAGSVYYDPAYNPNNLPAGHDFCMLKFSGASASTPTLKLPTSASDGVATNVDVEHVGYGKTNTNSNNSTRRTGTNKITSFNNATISYKQGGPVQTPGPCEGDSGGPALVPTGVGVTQAQQTVVGVTSFGTTETCGGSDTGTSGRVSSVIGLDNNNNPRFITAYLNDTPIGTPGGSAPTNTCDSCQAAAQSGACASQTNACANDPKCVQLGQCYAGCQTQTCISNCETQAGAQAVAKYQNYSSCICNTGCPTECADVCPAGCGVTSNDAKCDTCINSSCCSQAEACIGNATCKGCLSAPTALCSGNAQYAAFSSCLQNDCGTACGFSSSSSSSSSSGGTPSTSANSSSGGTTTGSSASGNPTTTGVGGAGGAGGEGGEGGGTPQVIGGCSVGSEGSDAGSKASLAGLLLGVALAFSRRRRSA